MKTRILSVCFLLLTLFGCSSNEPVNNKIYYDFEWNYDEFDIRPENTTSDSFSDYRGKLTCIGGYLFMKTSTYYGYEVPTQIMTISEDGKSSHPVECRIKSFRR